MEWIQGYIVHYELEDNLIVGEIETLQITEKGKTKESVKEALNLAAIKKLKE